MELEPHLVAKLKDEKLDPTQRVVEAIMTVGPRNAALISRLTGVPTETVRYKIKKQLKELGFRIHANVDYEKLGLRRHWAIVDFTPEYADLAVQIFNALHEIGYLVYYARIIPHGHYTVQFALPEGSTDVCRTFLNHLVDLGIIRRFSLERVGWTRHLSMNPKYFNFDSGNWEIDWRKIEAERTPTEKPAEFHHKADVDKADMLLIKELQKDSIQSIIDIARKVKIHPKTLRYHYHAHVEHRSLIRGYLVRWMRDIESTRAHSIFFARFVFRDLDDLELKTVRTIVLKLPFIWAEDWLDETRSYIAGIFIPIEYYAEVLNYVSKQVGKLSHKMSLEIIDPFTASLFTVPYTMFEQERGWLLNVEDLKARFSNLAKTI